MQPYMMRFADFAAQAHLSGAVNRVPDPGTGLVRTSFSVYFNGPFAAELPFDVAEQEFDEGRTAGVVTRLGLDETSERDKLKTAELIALRSAWMSSVMDASLLSSKQAVEPFAPGVLADYESLIDGFGHPWIEAQVLQQQAMAGNLPQVLKAAEASVGRSVTDQIPDELSQGVVVAQSPDFTVQATQNGVVTHENRRLSAVPAVGADVTVLYYKGGGQVIENGQNLAVSSPFIEPNSGDLAISVVDGQDKSQKVLLFNGVASFAQFVSLQGLNRQLVEQALDVRSASPKRAPDYRLPDGVKMAEAGRFVGKVASVSGSTVIQDVGPGEKVAHRLTDFAVRPVVGEVIDVQRGRDGKVSVKGDTANAQGRGR